MTTPGSVTHVPGTPDDYTILQGNIIKNKSGDIFTVGSFEFIRFLEDKWKIINGKFVPMYNKTTVTTSPNVSNIQTEEAKIGQALINKIGLEAARKLIR